MIKQYFVALVSLLIIDGVWLTVVAKNFYAKYLGYLMAKNPNLLAAGLFYLIYILGLVVLVINPAVEKKSLNQALIHGALLGLCAYSTYDLTNMATIKDWPMIVTVFDLIWGTVLTMAIAGVSYWIMTK